MNKKKFYLFFGFLFLFLILMVLIFIFLTNKFSIIEVRYIPVNFSVGDTLEIVSNEEGLNYGTLSPGMAGVKSLIIENPHNFDIKVEVFIEESLENFVSGNKSFFILSGENFEYFVRVNVPLESSFGDYSGRIKLEIKKAKFPLE